jgi:hypothetical protein
LLVRRYGEKQRRNDSSELSGIQLLSATAYQLKKPYQQLLIPITVWIGMEQAFIGAEFTQVINLRRMSIKIDVLYERDDAVKAGRNFFGSLAILLLCYFGLSPNVK